MHDCKAMMKPNAFMFCGGKMYEPIQVTRKVLAGVSNMSSEKDRLRGIVCGMPHSGTTFLANSLTSGGEVFNKFETGFLLKTKLSGEAFLNPNDDMDKVCHGSAYLNSLKNIYKMTDQEIYACGQASSWRDAYNIMFDICRRKELDFPYRYIIDKTPSYARNIDLISSRVPDVAIILTYCDPRKFVASAVKRMKEKNLKIALRVWKEYAEVVLRFREGTQTDVMLVSYEELIMSPKLQFESVCNHLKIPFYEDMLDISKSINAAGGKSYRKEGRLTSKVVEYKEVLTELEQEYLLNETKGYHALYYHDL